MEILYIILLLLVIGRIFSELAIRCDMPALLGEIIAGVLLGIIFKQFSNTFPVLSTLNTNEVFHAITELGIFFLMLYAGIELRPKDIGKASIDSVWVALGGTLLPLILGVGLGLYAFPESEFKVAQVVFLGVSIAITAVPVTIKILMDVGLLQHRIGKIIVSAAVIDDVFSLLLLAVLTVFIKTSQMPEFSGLILLGGKILLFFIITYAVGKFLLPLFAKLVINKTNAEEMEFSFLLIMALGFSVLAEFLEIHFILGAFIAGLFFVKQKIKTKVYNDVENKIKGITTGFLAPIFFVSIGLSLDITAITAVPLFVIGLIIVASIGKIIGAGLPAKLIGLPTSQSLVIGNAMNARGAVELIIADIALRAGLFEIPGDSLIISNLFSAVVIMAIVTTIISPVILKFSARKIVT